MSTRAETRAAAAQDPSAADDLRTLIEQLRGEVRGLAQRLAALEAQPGTPAAVGAAHAGAQAAGSAAPARDPGVTEEDLLAIAAAVAAFLGVRAQIRQVRLVQSAAWAQMGRATIHASHRI